MPKTKLPVVDAPEEELAVTVDVVEPAKAPVKIATEPEPQPESIPAGLGLGGQFVDDGTGRRRG